MKSKNIIFLILIIMSTACGFSEEYYLNEFKINEVNYSIDNINENLVINTSLYTKWPDEDIVVSAYLTHENSIIYKNKTLNTLHGDNFIEFSFDSNGFSFDNYNLSLIVNKKNFDNSLEKEFNISLNSVGTISNSLIVESFNFNNSILDLNLLNPIDIKNVEFLFDGKVNFELIEVNSDKIKLKIDENSVKNINGFYYNLVGNDEKIFYYLESGILSEIGSGTGSEIEDGNVVLLDEVNYDGLNLALNNVDYDNGKIKFDIINNGNGDITLFEINIYDENLDVIYNERVLYLKKGEIIHKNISIENLTYFEIAIDSITSEFNEVVFEDNYFTWPNDVEEENGDNGMGNGNNGGSSGSGSSTRSVGTVTGSRTENEMETGMEIENKSEIETVKESKKVEVIEMDEYLEENSSQKQLGLENGNEIQETGKKGVVFDFKIETIIKNILFGVVFMIVFIGMIVILR